MKGECFTEKLERAVRHASRMTSKNPSLPVLSCIFLEAQKGSIVVRATNIDIAYESVVPARVEHEGVVAVSGNALNTFLSGISSPNTSFSSEGNGFSLHGGNARATFKVFPHDDFPKFTTPKKDNSFSVPVNDIALGLKSVLYSASPSSVRPELASVYIFSEGEGVVFVATDSFRLAERQVFPQKSVSVPPTLVPARNALELLRVLSESESEACTVLVGEGQCTISYNGVSFTSRVIDGSFPDYKQIIPKETTTTITLLKEDFAHALQLAGALSEKSNQISLSVPENGKEISLHVKNTEVGEGTSVIPASVQGESFETSFNSRYLSDCLAAISESGISLLFAGAGKPLVIKPASGRGFRYIVMPMNR